MIPDRVQPTTRPAPTIVTVHGLGRTRLSMAWMGHQIAARGFQTIAISYCSTRQSIAQSADQLHRQLEPRLPEMRGPLHFVTHSLGGIVVRTYLQSHRPPNLGRVVMLGPPNRGSELADRLRHHPLYRLATGPAGQELGTDSASTPNSLGPVDYDVGVIAGRRSLNPLSRAWIPGDNDGKVSVTRAAVSGMRDMLVLDRTHTFLMRSPEVVEQTLHFIEHGCFRRAAAPHPGTPQTATP